MQETQVTRFVVVDENLFGYINPEFPNHVGILATSVIRGSCYSWMDGAVPVPEKGMRPATRKDFDDFRISPKGYEEDTRHYLFPAN